jgi:hypothetical protein
MENNMTLSEWTKFCEEDKSIRLSVIQLPVLEEAFDKAIPGSKKHCSVANALAIYTGMDPDIHKISVNVKYIKFVLNGVRYFFIHEVVGAEHIKMLDSLTFEGHKDVEFTPFILKLRYHEQHKVYVRTPPVKPPVAVKAKKMTMEKGEEMPSAAVISEIDKSPTGRPPRKDRGMARSRWAR